MTCLRALKVDADAGRVALCAASIVVHAYAMGRAVPEAQDDALRIVELARQFYALMPTRDALAAIVDESLAELAAGGPDRRTRVRERLISRVFDLFHRGRQVDRP